MVMLQLPLLVWLYGINMLNQLSLRVYSNSSNNKYNNYNFIFIDI